MAADYDVRVTASLLDRLIDHDPRSPRDAPTSRAESVRELKRGVQRDLEWLLNSRNPNPDLDAAFTEVWQSVLTYGLPDFTVANDVERLKHHIQSAIRTFEPRLLNPTVTLLDGPDAGKTMQIRIDARLVMDPAPEPVSFDVVLPKHTVRPSAKESS